MELNNYLNTFIDVIYENCLLMNSAIFSALYNVFYCVDDILHTINHLVDVIKYAILLSLIAVVQRMMKHSNTSQVISIIILQWLALFSRMTVSEYRSLLNSKRVERMIALEQDLATIEKLKAFDVYYYCKYPIL